MNDAEPKSFLSPPPRSEQPEEDAAVRKFSALRESIKQRLASPNPKSTHDLLYPYASENEFGHTLRKTLDRQVLESRDPRLNKLLEDTQA